MPIRREQVAAALQYLGDKVDLKRRYERMVSLDQPQDADAVDMALEMGGNLVPGVGQALAARDFERARRADDETGMAIAAASAVPIGKLVGALKQYDPTMLKMGDVVEFKAKKPNPPVEASPSADDWAEKLAQSIGNQIPMRPENEVARDLLKYKNQKALNEALEYMYNPKSDEATFNALTRELKKELPPDAYQMVIEGPLWNNSAKEFQTALFDLAKKSK
jgi:hypothetical protein